MTDPSYPYLIVNASGADLTDVNGAGDDVANMAQVDNVQLTAAELETLLVQDGVAVTQTLPTKAQCKELGPLLKKAYDGSSAVTLTP